MAGTIDPHDAIDAAEYDVRHASSRLESAGGLAKPLG